MADADVTITAGTGTKIDTRTVGGGTDEHRQVVVIGDGTSTAIVGLSASALLVSDSSLGAVLRVAGQDTYVEASQSSILVTPAVRRDADTTLVGTTNEYAPLQVDARGMLKVEVFSGGEDIPVSNIDITNIRSGVHNTDTLYNANDNAMSISAVRRDADTTIVGTTNDYAPLQVDARGNLKVEIFSGGESIPTTATLAAGTATNEMVGDVAHSIAAAGNPVLNAGVSQNHDDTAPPNRVDAEGDATRLATDWDGSLFVRPHGPQVWTYHVNGSSALTDTSVHAAPGSGLSLYVGTIVFSSGAATAINMFLEEGASTVMGPYYLEAVAGRGMAVQFNPPRKISANTALTITTSAAIAHSVDITGFTAQG